MQIVVDELEIFLSQVALVASEWAGEKRLKKKKGEQLTFLTK